MSTIHIKGTFQKSIFQRGTWGILAVIPSNRADIPKGAINEHGAITITGDTLELLPGEVLRITGKWVKSDYGPQLKATAIQPIEPDPTNQTEVVGYIQALTGISNLIATTIWNFWKEETLNILDNDIAQLAHAAIPHAPQIIQMWQQNRPTRIVMSRMEGQGIGASIAVRIWETFGLDALDKLQTDPYEFATQGQSGITFDEAENIAKKLGIKHTINRTYAAVLNLITKAERNGHCYLPYHEMLHTALNQLKMTKDQLDEELVDLNRTFKIHVETYIENEQSVAAIYQPWMAKAETRAALQLEHLATQPSPIIAKVQGTDWKKYLEELSAINSVSLTDEQQSAVVATLTNKVSVLTGGPGTGKTTTLRMVINGLKREGVIYDLAAPTGKAAKRMSESIGDPSVTIHRLLAFDPETNGFTYNATRKLPTQAVVVDEASMIDLPLLDALLQALPDAAHLVLVGDVDQLPSVGPGDVLKDIIDAPTSTVTKLTKIFRQGADSHIVANAYAINNGNINDVNISNESVDFFYFTTDSDKEIGELTVDIIQNRLYKVYEGYTPILDAQIVAPMYKGNAGIDALNTQIQAALNPPHQAKGELKFKHVIFRKGDKVIQTTNNYDKEVYNGDTGIIIDVGNNKLYIEFDDEVVEYEAAEARDELMLAYAISTHRSQGSEYPIVIIPVSDSHGPMLVQNLLYTAVTRARKMVVLVGQYSAIKKSVETSIEGTRHTGLLRRLTQRHNQRREYA